MGLSTDGILAYGVPLEEDEFPPNLTKEEWEKCLYTWDDEEIKGQGFEVENYCSRDYPIYFLAVPGSTTRASRGYPKPITDMDIDAGDLLRWREAMTRIGINTENEGWYLFSYMG